MNKLYNCPTFCGNRTTGKWFDFPSSQIKFSPGIVFFKCVGKTTFLPPKRLLERKSFYPLHILIGIPKRIWGGKKGITLYLWRVKKIMGILMCFSILPFIRGHHLSSRKHFRILLLPQIRQCDGNVFGNRWICEILCRQLGRRGSDEDCHDAEWVVYLIWRINGSQSESQYLQGERREWMQRKRRQSNYAPHWAVFYYPLRRGAFRRSGCFLKEAASLIPIYVDAPTSRRRRSLP